MDVIDQNNSPINATSPELDALHRDLAEIESKLQRLHALYPTRLVKRLLYVNEVKRDAIKAQIKVWGECDIEDLF